LLFNFVKQNLILIFVVPFPVQINMTITTISNISPKTALLIAEIYFVCEK